MVTTGLLVAYLTAFLTKPATLAKEASNSPKDLQQGHNPRRFVPLMIVLLREERTNT